MIVRDTLFDFVGGLRECSDAQYELSIINTTSQHDEIVNILTNQVSPIVDGITQCWLGAYGFFISEDNTTITWTWSANINQQWDSELESQYMVASGFRVDFLAMQGLIMRQSRNQQWIWTYGTALFASGSVGRQCVVCLNTNPS